MSCCGTSRPINPARPGDTGRWVLPRSPARSARCVHTYVYRNQLDLVGGPVVKVCTGCGYTVHPTWVPDVGARLALPAVQTFQVGEAEWVEATPHGRGAA